MSMQPRSASSIQRCSGVHSFSPPHSTPGRSASALTHRAFTLLESLLVIVIISTVLAVVAVGVGRSDASAQLRALQHALQDLDSTARLQARISGSKIQVRWPTHDHAGALLIGSHPATPSSPPGLAQLDPRVTLAIDPPELRDALSINSRGRSPDYAVTIELAQRALAWRVCGLTGAIMNARVDRP